MTRRFYSISAKLLASLLAATTLPMLLYCLFFSLNMRHFAEKEYIERSRHTWRLAAENMAHSLATSIEAAGKGIYLNDTLQNMLFSRDGSAFSYAESPASSLFFSYMTNLYAMTPDATQIQLSAYKPQKSFLLTTKNLQRYVRTSHAAPAQEMPSPAFTAYTLPPHSPTSYGHRLSHLPISIEEEAAAAGDSFVFTVCLPLYHLPQPDIAIAELRLDISLDFFKNACQFLYSDAQLFQIVDRDGTVIFSPDSALVGRRTTESWVTDMVQSVGPGSLLSELAGSSLRLCQRIPGNSCDWFIVKSVPTRQIYQSSNWQLLTLLVTFAVCLLITLLLNGGSILRFTLPLKKATDYLNAINRSPRNLHSRLSEYVVYQKQDEIGILLDSLQTMIDRIDRFVIRQYELEIVNRTTALKMLEAQVNPHFIYNTLQCLATNSLAHHDQEQYDYISSFGQLMQYSMDTSRTLVTVQEELTHIDRYIRLQKMRFSSRLSVFIEADETIRALKVPKMILQPLIENSFKHGCLFKRSPGRICIRARMEGRMLQLSIEDNGRSPSPERIKAVNDRLRGLRDDYIHRLLTPERFSAAGEPDTAHREGLDDARRNCYASNNIGLGNVLLRLLLNFGEDCSLALAAAPQGGTCVHLTICVEPPEPAADHPEQEESL